MSDLILSEAREVHQTLNTYAGQVQVTTRFFVFFCLNLATPLLVEPETSQPLVACSPKSEMISWTDAFVLLCTVKPRCNKLVNFNFVQYAILA